MRRTIALLVALSSAALAAQPDRPKAEVATIAESQGVHAGTHVRLALQVRLPDGVHVQADRPRDPLLIATVLTLDPPAGITLIDTAYPDTRDFKLAGQPEPLTVFDQSFAIGATISVAADVSGIVVVPGRFRYQACDASTCFAPLTEQVRWTLPVVPQSAAIAHQFDEVFAAIKFKR